MRLLTAANGRDATRLQAGSQRIQGHHSSAMEELRG
jgi:hypothetical protein